MFAVINTKAQLFIFIVIIYIIWLRNRDTMNSMFNMLFLFLL